MAFLPQGFKTISPDGDVAIVLVDPAIHCASEGFYTDTNLAIHGGFQVWFAEPTNRKSSMKWERDSDQLG